MKIHYVGSADKHDEWREAEEVESVCKESKEAERYTPFDPHREVAFQIKASLNAGNRKDVDVRIDMPFDRLLFNGGLKQKAFHQGRSHGHDMYGIRQYSDLNSFLGEGWHMRALNERLDFCYVNLGTVKFYLHERKPLLEFDASGAQKLLYGGPSLIFVLLEWTACGAAALE